MELLLPYILALVGIVISLVGFAGIWLVFIAIVLSGFIVGFDVIPIWFIIIAFIISVLSGIVDNIFLAAGAYKFGASKWGITGALIGGLVGLVTTNIIGVILGPFIGAVLFELYFAKKERDDAVKAGIGTFVGYCAGIFIKFFTTVVVVLIWLYLLNR